MKKPKKPLEPKAPDYKAVAEVHTGNAFFGPADLEVPIADLIRALQTIQAAHPEAYGEVTYAYDYCDFDIKYIDQEALDSDWELEMSSYRVAKASYLARMKVYVAAYQEWQLHKAQEVIAKLQGEGC